MYKKTVGNNVEKPHLPGGSLMESCPSICRSSMSLGEAANASVSPVLTHGPSVTPGSVGHKIRKQSIRSHTIIKTQRYTPPLTIHFVLKILQTILHSIRIISFVFISFEHVSLQGTHSNSIFKFPVFNLSNNKFPCVK